MQFGDVPAPDGRVAAAARRRQELLTKPRGALGRLEAALPRIQGLLGGAHHALALELADAASARQRAAAEALFDWCRERCTRADAVLAAAARFRRSAAARAAAGAAPLTVPPRPPL